MNRIRLTLGLWFVLGLAGVFPGAHLALAQSQEACPRPSALPALPEELVTAAQVESGDAALPEFVRGFREYSASLLRLPNATGYLGCLMTHEGPFRSGSTYLVTVTPKGRVAVHGKNVLLSGGLLDSGIFAPILEAAKSSEIGGPFMAEAANASGYASGHTGFDGLPTVLVAGFDL